jgi:hypothetical protein
MTIFKRISCNCHCDFTFGLEILLLAIIIALVAGFLLGEAYNKALK